MSENNNLLILHQLRIQNNVLPGRVIYNGKCIATCNLKTGKFNTKLLIKYINYDILIYNPELKLVDKLKILPIHDKGTNKIINVTLG